MRDYDELVTKLELPIGGKVYVVPPVSLRVGLQLIAARTNPELAGETELDLWKLVLGPVYQQMLDDDLPVDAVRRAGQTALADYQGGREVAERVWEAGIDPEFQAAVAAAALTASTTLTSTGSATKTRSRGSTKRTTARPASSSTTAKVSRSDGPHSLASGL